MPIFYFIDKNNNQQKYIFKIDQNNNIIEENSSSFTNLIEQNIESFSYGTYINNNLNLYYYVSGIVWIRIYSDGKYVYKNNYIPLAPETQPQIIGIVESQPIQFPTPYKNYNSDLTKFKNYISVLDDKKEDMENVLNVHNRWNMFNDTYSKRYVQYIKIICIIIFGIICIWLIKTIYNLNIISQAFLIFVMIMIISIVFICIYYAYQDILMHNLLKFDEIDYNAPKNKPKNSVSTPSTNNMTDAPCTACPSKLYYNTSTGMCSRNLF